MPDRVCRNADMHALSGSSFIAVEKTSFFGNGELITKLFRGKFNHRLSETLREDAQSNYECPFYV